MNCWHCERPAHGTCVFCGRAVCRDHVQSMPRIINLTHRADNSQYALVVTNTIYCGVCKPREDPIKLEKLSKLLEES